MSQTVLVQVKFEEETPYGTYRDALYYDLAEFNLKSQKEIDADAKVRIDAYIFAVENPLPPPEYTKEELQAQLDDVAAQQIEINVALEKKKEDLQDAIDVAAVAIVVP